MNQKKTQINNEKNINYLEKTFGLAVTIGGVAIAIANLWVVTKLSPITRDLSVLTTRVDAHEELATVTNETISKRLDKIEDKIDKLLSR